MQVPVHSKVHFVPLSRYFSRLLISVSGLVYFLTSLFFFRTAPGNIPDHEISFVPCPRGSFTSPSEIMLYVINFASAPIVIASGSIGNCILLPPDGVR